MKRQHYFHPLITLVNLRAREAAAAGSRYSIFHFSFPAPLNPQAASSAPAARWRDPSRKRKRKLVQPAGTEEISACLSIFPNPSRLSSPQRLQRKCCHIRGPSRRDGCPWLLFRSMRELSHLVRSNGRLPVHRQEGRGGTRGG